MGLLERLPESMKQVSIAEKIFPREGYLRQI